MTTTKKIAELFQYQSETQKMFDTLTSDVNKLIKKTGEEPEEHAWRRTVICTSISVFGTVCYRLKQQILKVSVGTNRQLAPKQIEFLTEEKSVSKHGRTK